MTAERYQRVKEVFLEVCDRPEPEQNEAAARLCGEDSELKAEVQSLLHSHREALKTSGHFSLDDIPEPQRDRAVTEPVAVEKRVEVRPPSGGSKSHVKRETGSSHRLHSRTGSGTRGDTTGFGEKGRFESGTVLAERYRIVSLLGSGGMGEVYRAEDLTLDQAVALKFLPPSFQSNQTWLARFHNEVRMARQVTHPNVCRVFDIAEVDGEQFISMEFVDGEDLASLLRRIGRLPRDKAIQIARQLCAGLAAAHDRGVLHRDLKPANVMLDGRGQVRITDFGISGRVDGGDEAAAGTPAYMAPEQFARGEATVRSDIYSLGLVLYEVFTGRAAFSAHSMLEYAKLHKQTSPTHPSTFMQDMDPIAERVILRCLEKDPGKRPGSALAVAAALPGGDPLAAALAAGETPSPEMVAAAGDDAAMSPVRVAMLLISTLLGLALVAALSTGASLFPRMHDPIKAPAVLADRARQVLDAAGYADAPAKSRAQGLGVDDQYISWVHAADTSSGRWDKLSSARPGPMYFWYRESPQYMISRDEIGVVTLVEPARVVPGMRTVVLDVLGRLKQLEILPDSSLRGSPAVSAKADFAALFQLADLKIGDFSPTAPTLTPPMFADQRFAWTGHYPEKPQESVRVEAASLLGRPVFFIIRENWQDRADAMGIELNPDIPTGRNIFLQATLILVALGSGLVLAWKNVRAGRGDSAAAQKLSAAFLVLGVLTWLLWANHVPQLFLEMRSFFRALGYILVPAAVVWMFYLALEPYVRRTWPETVISWTRALAGRLLDPLVGSHVLVGVAVGVAATVLAELANIIPMRLGHAAAVPNLTMLIKVMAKDNPSAMALWSLLNALYMGLLYLLSLVLFLIVLRRKWLASAALVILGAANTFQWYNASWAQWAEAAMATSLILLLLVRYGLVAAIAGLWATYLLRYLPITPDMSIWYSDQTRYALGLVALVALAAAILAGKRQRRTVKAL
jgi:serine/threonine-protein kinase